MERLTYRLKTGEVLMATEYEEKYTKDEWIGMLQCCLAAYEDLRLTPEEITAMQHTLDEYHKVADPLLRAQADGRLVVLPCKVGDTVYLIVTKRARIYAPEFRFIKKSKLTFLNMERVLQDFGKTVFLSREEAEKALEAMKDD